MWLGVNCLCDIAGGFELLEEKILLEEQHDQHIQSLKGLARR